MTMIVPADYEEARKATVAMGEMVGPAYIRFGRSPVPLFTTPDTPFQLGKANLVMEGTDVALIANGALVWESILAAKELAKKGISARVINVHTVKPFDVETVTTAARECGCIVTAEEHQVHAGLGGAVAEVTAKNAPVPIEFVGVKDSFGGSGEPEELMVKFGLTWKEIYASALVAMERRDKGSSGFRAVKDVPVYSA
jgi:transketolase